MVLARLWGVGILVLGLSGVACSGTDKSRTDATGASGGTSAGGSSSGLSPTEKCNAFSSTWCAKALGCLVTLGTLPADQEADNVTACITTAENAAHCSSATSIDSGYDNCISQTNAMACSSWDVPINQIGTVQPPASCVGIVHSQ